MDPIVEGRGSEAGSPSRSSIVRSRSRYIHSRNRRAPGGRTRRGTHRPRAGASISAAPDGEDRVSFMTGPWLGVPVGSGCLPSPTDSAMPSRSRSRAKVQVMSSPVRKVAEMAKDPRRSTPGSRTAIPGCHRRPPPASADHGTARVRAVMASCRTPFRPLCPGRSGPHLTTRWLWSQLDHAEAIHPNPYRCLSPQ